MKHLPSQPALPIRLLVADDGATIAAVAALLRTLALEFIVANVGAEQASTFLRENDADALGRRLADGFVYHVAEDDGAIAGFIGMRAQQHVFHLFVGRPWQRRGVARRLWEVARAHAIAAGGAAPFTVNASNYAVDAYTRLGFVRSAPMREKNGIEFHPMQWSEQAN
ncbi:GNAT family N-acetyltransferase [Massilia sp. PWRC2]|uniref:GNAT family N-acetyltransferase n=1 Tax=Massilia sp. PWRC2 TaxID=2804626 RepID=UPI003CEEF5EE